MTWWERGGRIKNLQGTYQERKKNLIIQKMPILTTSSLRSMKKFRTQRGLRGLRLVLKGALCNLFRLNAIAFAI
jgi:hypothetical protein